MHAIITVLASYLQLRTLETNEKKQMSVVGFMMSLNFLLCLGRVGDALGNSEEMLWVIVRRCFEDSCIFISMGLLLSPTDPVRSRTLHN